jgi:DNA-binding MarR family transcriptional regulator
LSGDPHPDEEERSRAELGGTLEFMRTLWALDHALQRKSKRMEATFGVTGPQRLVIRIVGRFPGITAGGLARMLHVHPSTLTGVLRRLETKGLLARRPDPRDRRRAQFGLTRSGRAFDVDREGTLESDVRALLARFPRARIRSAVEILEALTREVGSS